MLDINSNANLCFRHCAMLIKMLFLWIDAFFSGFYGNWMLGTAIDHEPRHNFSALFWTVLMPVSGSSIVTWCQVALTSNLIVSLTIFVLFRKKINFMHVRNWHITSSSFLNMKGTVILSISDVSNSQNWVNTSLKGIGIIFQSLKSCFSLQN